MKRIGPGKLVVGAALLAAASLPVILSGSGSSVVRSSAASASGQDEIQYVQTTGNSGTYIQFVSGSTGKVTAKESVTSGGGCATPTPSGNPLIDFNGFLYSDGSYANPPTTGIVGAYKQRTGVCALGQAWSIDNVPPGTAPQTGAEALDFTLLPQSGQTMNSLVAGRIMSRAVLNLQRSDKLTIPVVVEFVETLQGTQTGSQCYSLPDTNAHSLDSNATLTYDSADCANNAAPSAGFDTLEVRVITGGGSVSVVGPSSTFYLANQICGGQTIATTSAQDSNYGQISFSVTLQAAATVCKSYTAFDAIQNVNPDGTLNGLKQTDFNSFGSGDIHFTFKVDWGNFPQCTPDGLEPGLPACPPTQVEVNNETTYSNQTYCAAASYPNQPLCTTSRNYSYVTVPAGTYTDIQETWDGLIDNSFRI